MIPRLFPRGAAIAALALVFAMPALSATRVRPGRDGLRELNTWLCPEGYDQHSDCEKIGGVTAEVAADGVVVGQITSIADTARRSTFRSGRR